MGIYERLSNNLPAFCRRGSEKYVKEAYNEGILSANHRSQSFMDLYKKTQDLLRAKLNVPEDYFIFFTSSATECWEIIAQSLIDTH
ncbi:MAG: aminotransferase class V-fold PLP-dependent enzyme, partial [Bacteroidota bacterium]